MMLFNIALWSVPITLFGISIKIVHSNNRGEYFKVELTEFIDSASTCAHSPQQNGMAKRKK